MKINRKKSGIIFHKFKSRKTKTPKSFNGYPIVDSYKYLGIYIDSKLSFQPHLEYIQKKIDNGFKLINVMKWKKLGTWQTTYVWMTYILPYLRYGSLIFRERLDNDGNP